MSETLEWLIDEMVDNFQLEKKQMDLAFENAGKIFDYVSMKYDISSQDHKKIGEVLEMVHERYFQKIIIDFYAFQEYYLEQGYFPEEINYKVLPIENKHILKASAESIIKDCDIYEFKPKGNGEVQ